MHGELKSPCSLTDQARSLGEPRRSVLPPVTRRAFLKRSALAGIVAMVAAERAPGYNKGGWRNEGITLEEAAAFHRQCLILDAHNDNPIEHTAGRHETLDHWMEPEPTYQTDVPRMQQDGQRYMAVMICGAGHSSHERTVQTLDAVREQAARHPKALQQILTTADVETALRQGKVGFLSGIEGGRGPIAGKLDNYQQFYRKGLRLAGISHGEGGPEAGYLQGSKSLNYPVKPQLRASRQKTDIGLTPFGLDALKVMNELGILTDLAHINDKAFMDVIEKSTRIPIASHTNVYALCQQGRCVTDDQIKALAAKGGVLGMTFVRSFIANNPERATVDRYIDHICYIADMVGIEHVCVGTDFDGGVPKPLLADVSRLVELTRALMIRGFSNTEIKSIWSGNLLRVMKQVIDRQA